MTGDAPVRDLATRIRDSQARLRDDHDAWLATAGPDGPWLAPLSFHWDGATLLFATLERSTTVRNILVRPMRVQAWREESEIRDRTIFRDGDWRR